MKRTFTFIFFAAMALMNVVAQTVAKIGDVEYTSFREAVEAANESDSPVTITLLESVNDADPLSIDFKNSKALVTLDLNGDTIVVTSGNIIVSGKLKIVNSATRISVISTNTKMTLLYVKESGQLDIDANNMRIYSAKRTITVGEQATLSIDGKVENPKDLSYVQIESREAACVENYGTSSVKNVRMKSTGDKGRCFLAVTGTLEISNISALTTYYNVLKLENGCGDVTVNDSYFECQNFSGTINNSSKTCTLTLNNVQCYNKNVSGWNYNHADHRAVFGATGSKIVINGGKYWSDINQAISTDGEIVATDMTITTRPLRGLANAKLTLNNCNINVGNFTAIDVTPTTPVEINGGTYQSSTHIMTIPSSKAVTIKNATLQSASASASLLVCTEGSELAVDNCVFSTEGTALQLAKNSNVTFTNNKVKAHTPFGVPEMDEGGTEEGDTEEGDTEESETIYEKNFTVVIENSVFSTEPDSLVIPSGYVCFRNTNPETAIEYPFALLPNQDAFTAYKAGAAAYVRGMKDNSYQAETNEQLEQIALQIEAMSYDETKTYAEQTANIEDLIGSIDGLAVAVIGDAKFLSLRAAIAEANNSTEDVTIKLVNSFADNVDDLIIVNNTNGKQITLDVNGKSFTLKKKGIDTYSTLNVLNTSPTKASLIIAGVSGAFLFCSNDGGVLNINGTNCSFSSSTTNNRLVLTWGTGIATVDGGSYSAKHNCFFGNSEGKLTIKNLSATASGQCTIAIYKGPADIEKVTSVVSSGNYNALYVMDGAGDVYAKNSTFKSGYNASVVKVYSPATATLTLDKCEVNNSDNLASPSPSKSNHAMYINTAAHVVITNGSYIHSLTNRPVRSLGYVEADNSTFYGYYGFLVESTSAKAKLTDCKLSAKYQGALTVNANCSPNNETSISGGTFSATNSYVFNIGAGNKIAMDNITMSGTGQGLVTAGDVTVSNSILGGSVSAVRITGAGKATLKDCRLAAPTPLAKASDSNNHSVTCQGTVIANNIIDENLLIGMVCGANTDTETNTLYPYVAQSGEVAFSEYQAIVKSYIEEYRTKYPVLETVINEQITALDAMTYDPNTVFANQAAAMLQKAKNVVYALMDIVQGGETAESVVNMVALVKGTIDESTDTSSLESAKNDGMNAIIDARSTVMEAAKTEAKTLIDEALAEDPTLNETAAEAKQNIDAAQTTAEVDDAFTDVGYIILQNKVNEAKKYNVGDGLCKYTYYIFDINSNEIWQTCVDSYQDVVDQREATGDEVREYITTVKGMIDNLRINQPASGTFLRIKGGLSNKYADAEVASSDQTERAARVGMSENNGIGSIWYLNDEKRLISFDKGYFIKDSDKDGNETNASSYLFAASERGAKGRYGIKTDLGKRLSDNATQYNCVDCQDNMADETENWILEEVTSLPVAINANGFASVNLPVAITLNANTTAWYASAVSGDEVTLTKITGTLAANTPAILINKENKGKTILCEITSGGDEISENEFEGTIANQAKPEDKDTYVLSGDGVKKYTGEILKGFRAYLPVEQGQKIRSMIFDGEDIVTVIDAAEGAVPADGKAYDLNGRTVVRTNGIVILNGKTISVK